MCSHESARRQSRCPQSAAGIEAEPANPEQASANKTDHKTMRFHAVPRVSNPLSQVQSTNQCRDPRGDVNHRAAREIETWDCTPGSVKQSALAPDHMRHREIHDKRP